MKLRVGIVGLGESWEHRHAPALRTLADRFQVRAVTDSVARRADAVASAWGARSVDGFHALAAQEDVDALLVLSTDWFGELPLFAACAFGKAVFCATPVEINAERAADLRRRTQESGIAFVAELPNRHSPATLRLKELIATRLGAPRLLFCAQRQFFDTNLNYERQRSMGRLIHSVDWCRYIVGQEPSGVSCVAHSSPTHQGLSDLMVLSLDFSDRSRPGTGPMATIRWDGFLPSPWKEAGGFRAPADLQVVCERGVAFVNLPDKLVWFDDAGQHTESLDQDRPVGEQLLIHFHRAVTRLVLDTSGLDDAHRALEIIHQARVSQIERRWVG